MNQYQIEGQQMLIDSLDESIAYMKTQYVNQDISHAYKSDRLITKISCVLEGELNIVLQKALIANSKGKQEITAYQIQDALDILARELSNPGPATDRQIGQSSSNNLSKILFI